MTVQDSPAMLSRLAFGTTFGVALAYTQLCGWGGPREEIRECFE